jgi:hypothetical protein
VWREQCPGGAQAPIQPENLVQTLPRAGTPAGSNADARRSACAFAADPGANGHAHADQGKCFCRSRSSRLNCSTSSKAEDLALARVSDCKGWAGTLRFALSRSSGSRAAQSNEELAATSRRGPNKRVRPARGKPAACELSGGQGNWVRERLPPRGVLLLEPIPVLLHAGPARGIPRRGGC